MPARFPLFLPVAFLSLTLPAAAAPVILNGAHYPILPAPGDAITVSAEITAAAQATLRWRVDGAAEFTSVPMSAIGTAWTGTIPSQSGGRLIEFSIQASGDGTASWPSAAQSALLQVEENSPGTSTWTAGAVPVWRILTTAAGTAQLSGGSEVQSTVIIRDAAGTAVRHGCALRQREATPKTLTLRFPTGNPWNGRQAVILSADRPHSQALGAAIFRRAGLPAAGVETIEVRLNGANAAASGAPSYGRFALIEPFDAQWAARQFPASSGGNLYRMDDTGSGTHGALAYETPATSTNYGETYFKTAGPAPHDHADVIALTNALSNAPAATYRQDISQRLDLDQWLRYLALDSLIGNAEPGLQTGRGTDVVLYHLPSSDRILLVPNEMRLVMNLSGGGAATRSLYSSDATAGLNRFMTHPDILPSYNATVHELLDSVFNSATLNPLISAVMDGWVPASEITAAQQFITDRRAFVTSQLPATYGSLTITGDAAPVENVTQTTTGTLTLSGTFPVAQTGSILVNGVPATANFRSIGPNNTGTWSFTASAAAGTLYRGMNSFLVEFFSGPNGTGTVLHRLTGLGYYSGGGTTVTTITAPAIVTDTLAAPGGAPPAAAPANSGPWRYLAAAAPAGWQSDNFDDSTWTQGTPHLGFGETDQRSTVPNPAGRATWYFRRTFNVEASALPLYTALNLRMVYDDGAIVYLNGEEVVRRNLPTTGVTDASSATAARSGNTENSFESIPLTTSLGKLRAGINTLAVEIHNFQADNDLSFDAELTGTRPATDGVRWTAAGSPYRLTANATVPAGARLIIEPGTSVFVSPGRQLIVRGTIRVEGTPYARVRFSHVPGATPVDDADLPGTQIGPPKWKGIHIEESLSPDNLIAYADFDNAQVTGYEGSITLFKAACVIDHCTFQGSKLHAIRGENMSITVQDCYFYTDYRPGDNPLTLGLDNGSEFVQLSGNTVSGAGYLGRWPIGGVIRIYRNTFEALPGHNDLLDVIAGAAGVTPILDCQDNLFLGPTGDESIDMDGDAYVAGNFFSNVKKDQYTEDKGYANALSSNEGDAETTVVMTRNVFTRVDHPVNIKNASAVIFEHNTVASQNADYLFQAGSFSQTVKTGAVNFTIPEDSADPGDGAYLGYNIFFGATNNAGAATGGYPRILSWADTGGGANFATKVEMFANFVDPAIVDPVIGPMHPKNVLDPVWQGVTGDPLFRDVAADDYSLKDTSPAIGSAPHGLDYGATIPKGCYLGNLPAIVTPLTTASIIVGGPGIFKYKWRMAGGAWSAPVSISPLAFPRTGATVRTATLTLPSVSPGARVLEVIGQDFAGNWTPDSEATRATWTVDTTTPLVILNEVQTGASGGIELFNAGIAAIPLTGWSLTDNPAVPNKYPLSGQLAPGAWLTLASAQTGINLPASGGSVYLVQGATQRDVLTFGPQAGAYSVGRTGRERTWNPASPTPNAANTLLTTDSAVPVLFNEWVTGPGGWVELVNTGALPAVLDGLRLTTNVAGAPAAYVFPPHSLIAPGAHLTVPFDINPLNGALTLLDGDEVIDSVPLSRAVAGASEGRSGDGKIVTFQRPTPGAANSQTAPATFASWMSLYGVTATADNDADGLVSLAEYGLGTDPLDTRSTRTTDLQPRNGRDPDGSIRFTFTLPANASGTGRADLITTIESAANPAAGPWTAVATKTGTAAWTGAATVTTGPAEGGYAPVSVRVVPPAAGNLFFRLKFASM